MRTHTWKLEQVIFRLRDRDKALFDMCEKAVKRSDSVRAQMYANEMVRVRTLIKVIGQCQLAVECVIIRLENFMELHTVIAELKPVSTMIQGIAHDVSKVMPEIASEMDQLNTLVSDTLLESSVDFSQPPLDVSLGSKEGDEILKEVSSLLEEKLKDELPVPPQLMVPIPATSYAQEMVVEAVPISFRQKVGVQGKAPEGIGVSQGASALNILPGNVVKILNDLNEMGRVKLEECVT